MKKSDLHVGDRVRVTVSQRDSQTFRRTPLLLNGNIVEQFHKVGEWEHLVQLDCEPSPKMDSYWKKSVTHDEPTDRWFIMVTSWEISSRLDENDKPIRTSSDVDRIKRAMAREQRKRELEAIEEQYTRNCEKLGYFLTTMGIDWFLANAAHKGRKGKALVIPGPNVEALLGKLKPITDELVASLLKMNDENEVGKDQTG